ncbi:hypothetical protein SLEP1_g56346 [Rubroshorea leprosula]|uniref:DUF4220 domain-containing protein n=1 Tax=Rubroshorea leprosula TaxID=152421 RepID=A0AAV5MJB0_9ROSI|nr:hypothetical protein SLEP1_g56346 [Rubroshorea leprosula]
MISNGSKREGGIINCEYIYIFDAKDMERMGCEGDGSPELALADSPLCPRQTQKVQCQPEEKNDSLVCLHKRGLGSHCCSWLSILTIPLILAGIIKYVERILCLELTSSKKTEPVISESHHQNELEMSRCIDKFLHEYPDSTSLVLGYLLFSVMRPDVNDYLSGKLYLSSSQATERIKTYLKETKFNHQKLVLVSLLEMGKLRENPFEIAAAEMGFIFDTVYTKTSLIYTKKGCVLRVISFTCSFSVLLFFLISIMNEPKFHFSSVDIHITISLLVAAVALEFFAVYSMFSSNWTIPLILFHENRWVRKILWHSSNSKVYGFLEKCCCNRFLENLHKYNFTRFVEVPSCLKLIEDYEAQLDSFFTGELSFEPTRGQETLDKIETNTSLYMRVKESIELDFDTSVIVWHLATSICYYLDVPGRYHNLLIEDRKSSKYLSDYMMYLLALQPAMLLPENCRSFWLNACDQLKDLFSEEANMDHALTLLLNQDGDAWYEIRMSSSKKAEKRKKKIDSAAVPLNQLQSHASKLVIELNSRRIWDRWKMIKEMWIEMLLYAAHSCQHVNHIKQLAQSDREFLTLIWVMGGSTFMETTRVLNKFLR